MSGGDQQTMFHCCPSPSLSRPAFLITSGPCITLGQAKIFAGDPNEPVVLVVGKGGQGRRRPYNIEHQPISHQAGIKGISAR